MSVSTLYPKIRTKLPEIIHDLQYIGGFTSQSPPPTKLTVTGTVKLHGTHADILIYPDKKIVLQSRNCVNLSTTADNHGFAAAMKGKTNTLLALRDRYYDRYKELNPSTSIDEQAPLTIAGEWIGQNIQKGVALVHLSRSFVIISAHMNGAWVPDAQFGDISNEYESIFNIMRAGSYAVTIDLANLDSAEKELQQFAEDVAVSCPFAKTFGVEGSGEGIVWKFDAFPHESRVWFKTKGGPFKPNYAPRPKKLPPSDELIERRKAQQKTATECAKAWCSEGRLEQGLDFLREMGAKMDKTAVGVFLKWIVDDICVEEKWDIDELEVDLTLLKRAITDVAKPWYLKQCGIE